MAQEARVALGYASKKKSVSIVVNRLVAEDRTPVALFEVNMKATFIFLFVSILGLLAVKRSAAGKFIHFPVLLKRSASVVYAQYVFLHGCVVSCKEFFKSRFKSGSHEPYI